MAILPPGVGAEAFEAAMRELRAIVGDEWVFTADEDLQPYRDHFSYLKDQPNEPVPSAAVAPDRVEQVQAVVRIANRHKIPLYPISTGKNFAYGGPAPNVRGSVTVDLKRMNRILEVDDRRHFALVEPGVSYIDLYRPGARPQSLDRHTRPRLGQPDRQRARSRHRLHARLLSRPFRRA